MGSPRFRSVITVILFIAAVPLVAAAVLVAMTVISRAGGTTADITVHADRVVGRIDSGFYHAFAQGGEESGDMIAPVSEKVRALGPRIIRIDHIFDHYSVVSRAGSALAFDFSRLDRAVDSILTVGATPMLVLSYMPPAISRDGSVTGTPKDWNEWALTVEKTVGHYSGKTGKNIPGVYYEVWNEPDLEQFGSWKRSGEKNYLMLYRYALAGAGRAWDAQDYHIGGPATTGLYKGWIRDMADSGMRMDFISWHTYSSDPRQYAADQENLTAWLADYPRLVSVPRLITEAGFSGDHSALYGAPYAAAHTASVVRQLMSDHAPYLFTFELKDGPSQKDGSGWGLLAHESEGGWTKPRYGVFAMLDAVRGDRLELTGEGSWVTGYAASESGSVRMILANFDPSGSHTETVPVTVGGLAPGKYSVRERFLNGRDTEIPVEIGGSLSRTILMPAQSVLLLELEPVAE